MSPIEEYRYQKFTVGMDSFNQRSIIYYEKYGFKREGVLQRIVYTGDR